MSVPHVLGYQLHPRRSLRRENVIRINNSSHPLPYSLSIRLHTIPPSLLPFVRTFPDGASILWNIVPFFLAQPNFSHPCPSPRCRMVRGMRPSTNFTNLSTRARLRRFELENFRQQSFITCFIVILTSFLTRRILYNHLS